MRHLTALWLSLIVVGCSQGATTDEQTLRGHWKHPRGRLAVADAAAPGDASTGDVGAPSTQDASTTVVDASTSPPDSGTTTVDSGTTTVDSGTTTTVDSGTTTSIVPSGWLYTQGNKVYVSNGTSGTVWVGRGMNTDDIYLCGYNYTLWMTNAESTLSTMMSNMLTGWKPTFVRVSLGMNSNPTVSSWTSGNAATYKTPMTNIVHQLGANTGTYVLVTLRSDTTMTTPIDEATFLPTTATDAVYTAIVDSFAKDNYVAFGISNEPGGNALSNATIRSAMDHAVSVIRAEENKLGVPHHIVSVQGNSWTSDISFYATNPLPYDNVVYEVHGYPPPASSYTYSNIPVIIGEYGSLSNSSTFYADLESKQIPSLAWDFESFSNCAPDLLTVNDSATNLVATTWGSTVQSYLLAH
jgi:hypothetical protein